PGRPGRPGGAPHPGGAATTVAVALGDLNRSSRGAFVAALGGVFESSPWVAEAVSAGRPFPSAHALHPALASPARARRVAGPAAPEPRPPGPGPRSAPRRRPRRRAGRRGARPPLPRGLRPLHRPQPALPGAIRLPLRDRRPAPDPDEYPGSVRAPAA